MSDGNTYKELADELRDNITIFSHSLSIIKNEDSKGFPPDLTTEIAFEATNELIGIKSKDITSQVYNIINHFDGISPEHETDGDIRKSAAHAIDVEKILSSLADVRRYINNVKLITADKGMNLTQITDNNLHFNDELRGMLNKVQAKIAKPEAIVEAKKSAEIDPNKLSPAEETQDRNV